MKVTVDQKKCIGCGSCVATCPKHFKMNAKGKSEVIDAKVDKITPELKDAVDCCPVQCIKVEK